MFVTPWNNEKETKFITARNNRSYVYQYDDKVDVDTDKEKLLKYQISKLEYLTHEQ
jgi:hypothetical protein